MLLPMAVPKPGLTNAPTLARRQPRVCRLGVPPAGPGWSVLWGPNHCAGGLAVCTPAACRAGFADSLRAKGHCTASAACRFVDAVLSLLLPCCPCGCAANAAMSCPYPARQGADRLDQMVPDQAKRLMQVRGWVTASLWDR